MGRKIKVQVTGILDRYLLKKTELRINLLELLLKSRGSFSQAEIIDRLQKKMKTVDRVSIYRNLNQLKLFGIIHELENNKYVACSHDCEQHAHVLMFCQLCDRFSEIKDHQKLNIFFKAMGDFHFLSSRRPLVLKGLCSSCVG
jgi:Fe2+ or Zn2+ uptake regulation protein